MSLQAMPPHPHGGPDALGAPVHDFSTNSNACGPCATAWSYRLVIAVWSGE